MTASVLLVIAPQVAVTGVVRDSTDLEPVAFAQVTVAATPGAPVGQAVTDRYGAFVVDNVAAVGTVLIRVVRLGYVEWEREYSGLPVESLRVLLAPAPIGVEGLHIDAKRTENPLSGSPGEFVIDAELIRSRPVILETDVLRVTAMSPSASPPSDWVAAPFVRGGAGEGTPVMLDGVRLFNPFHVGGFVAALNAEAVRRVTLVTGSSMAALPVGSLSGMIDITTRDGARDRFRASGSVGLASTRMSAEGPVGESASFLVDARRTYLDLLTAGLASLGVGSRLPYSFGDVHGKLTKDFGGVRRLSVTAYWNDEFLDSRPQAALTGDEALGRATRADWANGALAAHYRDQFGPGGIVDASLGHSRFRGSYVVFQAKTQDSDTSSVIRGEMAEYRAEIRMRRHWKSALVEMGVKATRFEADHLAQGSAPEGGDPHRLFESLDLRESSDRLAAYVSAELPATGGVSLRSGLRGDYFWDLTWTTSVFAGLSYDRGTWSTWLSGARTHQELSSVRNEETIAAAIMAFDLLAPVKKDPLPRNTEVAAGWQADLDQLTIRIEGYARRMDNLRVPNLGENTLESVLLVSPSSRRLGIGTASGVEVSWSWRHGQGRANLEGSYRWARVARTVEGLPSFTPRFHRDHEGEMSASLRRGASMWSLRFSARSGQRTTPIVGIVPFIGHKSPDATIAVITDGALHLGGSYNSATLPPYVRLDIGWRGRREVNWFGGGVLLPFVSISNLFSLPNVVGVAPDDQPGGVSELVYAPQLPMLPFAGVEFRF